MSIKCKCWNAELKVWDECAYPLFKGMNPVEIIGFQDNDGNEKLIKDGNAVVLFSGIKDSKDKEIYENDICEDYLEDKKYVVKYSVNFGQWFLHEVIDGIIMNNVRYLTKDTATHLNNTGNIYENPELT